jgi:hypothetical protein
MIEDMTIRDLSRWTEQSYIYAVAKFSRHFGRSPDLLGTEEVLTLGELPDAARSVRVTWVALFLEQLA